MELENVEYRGPDDRRYVGFLVLPDKPNGAAVLIAHNAPGVSEFERGIAVRLAKKGYTAFCADYVGDGEVLTMEALGPRIQPYFEDPSRIRPVMETALGVLTAQNSVDRNRVAAIGYCFGGAAVLELGRSGADVSAIVGFHSSLPVNRPEDARNIRGKVLIQHGTADPLIAPDTRAAFEAQMDAAGVDWRMILYGGTQHGFTVPGSEKMGMAGVAYHLTSDERSWRAMLDLFNESIDLS
ncbi:dienelactone hydrolase family protein [Sphingomonas sp. KC8]|uniref:dienelactone hydrolase family protein n=1 Tax=Sphingomonas sp. KC8 TaxID=1030157 RepID=UPI000248B594|nr:dienelactone hydrolase family protein [Sphingomonas sp. KC8]ARS26946.1 hypothetical protein KC8_06540 [Sphingomonas sp. KC8]